MKWKKIKLREVLSHRKGFIEIDDETEYKLVTVKLHRKGVFLREQLKGFQIKTKKQQVCKAGDFIVAEMDAKVGGYGFIPDYLDGAIVSSHYFLFEVNKEKLRPKFLEVVSQLKIIQDQIKAVGSTNYAAIRPYNVLDWEIPLPPIEKQIEIENLYLKVKQKVDNLNVEFETQLTLLDQLNQAILQEAVQGKLVPQDPNDEPASELLKRILALSLSKGKPKKPLPPIKPEEIPFDIPENWVWCRLGEIAESTSGGTPDRSNPNYWNGDISWLKSGELTDGLIDNESEEKITEEGLKNSSAKLFPKGTLLIALYGATAGKLGILKFASTTNQAVCGFFENEFYDTKYLFYYLWAFRKKILKDSWGQAQPKISQTYLKNLPLAFPPLSEQKRIVAEIERQLAKTKQLKEHILANQAAIEQLLKALLHQAFEVKENEEHLAKA
jgi:type I restriction enzyme S subunit